MRPTDKQRHCRLTNTCQLQLDAIVDAIIDVNNCPPEFVLARRVLSIHADTVIAATQRPPRPVLSVYRAGGRTESGHLHFPSSASRRAKFAAAVRKAWGSSRNGGHCHFRQLKQQGWPQCAKDSPATTAYRIGVPPAYMAAANCKLPGEHGHVLRACPRS